MAGTIRKRESGAWQVRVYVGHDAAGKPRQRSRNVVGSKRDAEQELARMLLEVGETRGLVDNTVTVDQYLNDTWWVFKEPKLSPNTSQAWAGIMRNHITPEIGQMRLTDIRAVDLDGLYSRLTHKGLGPARVRQAHTVLSSAFNQAVKWDLVRYNPCVNATPPSVPREPLELPEPEQVRAFIDAAHPPLATYLTLLINLGARRSEVVALTWDDIDLDEGLVMIRRSAVDTKQGVVLKETKTGRADVLQIDDTTIAVLRRHRREHAETMLAIGRRIEASSFVFSDTGEKPWRPDSVTQAIRRLRDRTGIPINATALRHFAATMLLTAGLDPRSVAGRLRHARPSTTLDRYAEYIPAKDREASEMMTRILGG